ncbi:alpha/beta fold hydrolase [Roseovarius salis]|uniref:alpha/beta hydrolase n=1 Tax=Roseovarius salis TaxID=3376063 RepID=UPI0037CA45BB
MRRGRPLLTLGALVLAGWALWVLEGVRAGVDITNTLVGPTPVTRMSDGSGGPPVVVAHGFAGSRQMMQAYGLTLARAGYTVYAFDFEGHGRHRRPMRGDVGSIDGTTRLLVAQTRTVIDAARTGDSPVALLGHSMATDVLVRTADRTGDTGPLVLLSAFSRAITPTHPENLLLITGAWEPGLTGFAREALKMVDEGAALGQTAESDGIRRKAMLAPAVEHVAILHSRAGRQAALDWLNQYYDRDRQAGTPPTGWALIALLAAITALFPPVAGALARARASLSAALPPREFVAATVVPALATPLAATLFDTSFLPVLVADYLVLHLGIFGIMQAGLLWWFKGPPERPDLGGAVLLLAWAILVFGMALDRYGANFWPTADRVTLIALLCAGAVPFMLADSWLADGAPLWQRVAGRLAFLLSLGGAVALDFEGLFFLLMIAPVIVLFYLTFGVMGRATARACGPATAGLGLGVALAWALGVSFPLFAA